MDWSITACDQLTGLIVACALVQPEKKLSILTVESVLKKFKMSAFAKGADRNAILQCETKLNIPLPEFIEIVLKSMQGISKDLGL
jgi:predicted hydrolase (HD superfamily)